MNPTITQSIPSLISTISTEAFTQNGRILVSDSECSDEDHVLEVSDNESDREDNKEDKEPRNTQRVDTTSRNQLSDFHWFDATSVSYHYTPDGRYYRSPIVNVQPHVCMSILDSWKCIIPDEITEKIVLHTNQEIQEKATKYKERTRYIATTTNAEILAFIGLLYMSGVMKESHVSVEELWSDMYGPPIFHATMTLSRFRFLTSCIRFDDKLTRPLRKTADSFAAIREIWDMYVTNCRNYYSPSEFCAIGSNLLGFRGRCPFRAYKQNHPDKCGINILVLCDTRTNYMLNAVPYLGNSPDTTDESNRSYYVKLLAESIRGTNRNITMDKWFTSCSLADTLLSDYKLTMVGPLKRNKLEYPMSFVSANGREVGTSCYAFDNEKTLVSYVPVSNKAMILISTLHKDDSNDEETGRPKILNFFEKTKDNVPHFVQLCQNYTTARKTRRWPLRVFYGMLDQSAINAMIIYSMINLEWKVDRTNTRRSFLKELALALVKPYMVERQKIPTLRKDLKLIINNMVGEEETPAPQLLPGGSKKRCGLCPRKKDKKTASQCQSCAKPVCLDHRAMICVSCVRIGRIN